MDRARVGKPAGRVKLIRIGGRKYVCGRVEMLIIYICGLDILRLWWWVDGDPGLFLIVVTSMV